MEKKNNLGIKKKCTDHLGKTYDSIKEKCEAYNIEPETYTRRIKVYGMSEEEALTKPVKSNGGQVFYDHNGIRYKSFTRMCEAYGKDRKKVEYRLKHGYTLEQALTTEERISKIENPSN